MYKLLGWINSILLVFMISMFPLKYILKNKRIENMVPLYRIFRKFHPLIGITIIIIGIIHGFMALGSLQLHSGSILIGAIIISGLIIYIKNKINYLKHHWRNIHKMMGLVIIMLFILHLAVPYYI